MTQLSFVVVFCPGDVHYRVVAVTLPWPPSPPPSAQAFSVATGGALRGAGERAGERARGVPGAGEHAAFVGPPSSAAHLPRGPARAEALQRRRGHSGRRGLHGAAAANLIGGAATGGRGGGVPVDPGPGRARIGRTRRAVGG